MRTIPHIPLGPVLCVLVLVGIVAEWGSRTRNWRREANEGAVIRCLKTIATQQKIFQEQVEVDQDGDGVGEFGYLSEMSGEVPPRNENAIHPVSPVYLGMLCTGGANGNGTCENAAT